LIENFNENYKNNNYPSSISGEKQSLNTNHILNFKNNSLNEASLNFENRNFSQQKTQKINPLEINSNNEMSDNMAIQNNLHFIKEDINRLNQKSYQ